VVTHTTWARQTWFETRLDHQISWLRIFVVLLSSWMRITRLRTQSKYFFSWPSSYTPYHISYAIKLASIKYLGINQCTEFRVWVMRTHFYLLNSAAELCFISTSLFNYIFDIKRQLIVKMYMTFMTCDGTSYGDVSKSFRTGRLERELQMIEHSRIHTVYK
jgi:hypothetical protein